MHESEKENTAIDLESPIEGVAIPGKIIYSFNDKTVNLVKETFDEN